MLNKELFKHIYSLEIPEYPTEVKLSESRRAKYYSERSGTGRVTKITKRLEKIGYTVGLDGYLLDNQGKRIIANPRAAGTPRYCPINGQIFYSGNGGHHTRAIVIKFLHEYFTEVTKDVPVFTKFPLVIQLDWYCPYNYKTLDYINMASIYSKAFEDTLTETGKIPDDEVAYVTGGFPLYTPCDTFEERKLIFNFYQDLRPSVQQLKLI